MDVDINWLGVLLAAASSMAVGFVWYSEKAFGKTWMKLTKQKPNGSTEGVGRSIGITAMVSLITAFVLSHVIFLSHTYFQHSWLQDAITTSIWMWVGFIAARLITHDVFEGRSEKLTLINVSHELVVFVVMGVILGLVHP